jgi:prepilin-type N-terminal cleavage/methylation domain-containing protein
MPKLKRKKIVRTIQAFTIIEVLLVLAIVSLIVAIIFLAFPLLQSSLRDHQRKTYANGVIEAAQEFMKNNGGRLPFCSVNYPARCPSAPGLASRFITNYLPEGRDPSSGMSWGSTSAAIGSTTFCDPAMLSTGASTVYCYQDLNTGGGHYISHSTRPEVGQLYIIEDHTCCPCKATDYSFAPEDTIGHGNVNEGGVRVVDVPDTISVVMGLEHGLYCIDNHGRRD